MTDNKVSDLSNPKLNFKLKWIEPSFCKALMLVHISFDLKPYKQLIKDKMAVIKIMGTSFELNYDN
jgi:hypothetical protein